MTRTALSTFVLAALLAPSGSALAASSITTSPFMIQGSGAPVNDGDYVTSTGGLNTTFHYWIEVPPGTARITVEIWDADVGKGGAAEATAGRDRGRGGWNTTATYALYRPAGGASVASRACTDTTAACTDNGWITLYNNTTATAGHWELRVTMSGGDDINAFGIRAHDGTSGAGGTELNVYSDNINSYGVNPATGVGHNSRSYTMYPYITSGCTCSQSDFDYDSNAPIDGFSVGSVAVASRTSIMSTTFASATLSTSTAWATHSMTGWTSDSTSVDYGVWTATIGINSYLTAGNTQNGNYTSLYFTNYAAAAPPASANPQPNGFRVYLPTDAGVAPVKPYLEQYATYDNLATGAGPKTPAVGQTTRMYVSVHVINPTPNAITFSAGNLITANVPGSGAVYGGSATGTVNGVSTGTITAPAVGGTGNITWNPGSLAAGGQALLAYYVNVTPTSAGQRIPLTATPASGSGTRATFVDETGAAQARATLTLGPVCEVAVTAGVATESVVAGVSAYQSPEGVVVRWDTASEVGTAGFRVHRWDAARGAFVPLGERILMGLQGAPQGGRYRLLDRGASAREAQSYLIEEIEASGARRMHGPYRVSVERGVGRDGTAPFGGFDRQPRALAAPALPFGPSGPGPGEVELLSAGPWAVRVGVTARGLTLVRHADIAAAFGLSPAQAARLVRDGRLSLWNHGRQVAWLPGVDGLVFEAEAPASLTSRENAYFLLRGFGMLAGSIAGGGALAPFAASFRDTAHAEVDRLDATVVSTDPDGDHWYWDFLSAGDPSDGRKSFPLSLPDLAPSGEPARLSVRLAGATQTGFAGEHHVVVRLNGTAVGETQFDGIGAQAAEFAVPASLLCDGDNAVEVEALLEPGVPYSIVYVDGFDLAYTRRLRARDGALTFTAGAGAVRVDGLPSAEPLVVDVSDPAAPRRVLGAAATPDGAGGYAWSFEGAPAGGTYAVAAAAGLHAPSSLRAVAAPHLRAGRQGADYVVLTAHDLLAPAARLAALRAAQGLRTVVVDVDDVMNEFADGLFDPHALRDFLAYARGHWSPAPRFVVLGGAGSSDYKDNLGAGGDIVPPLLTATPWGLFASDNRIADVEGDDGVPEMAIGRLPARNAAELDAMVDKIARYERGDGRTWAGRTLFAADDAEAGADFPAQSASLMAALPAGYSGERDDLAPDALTAARATLFARWASGLGLLAYTGHGGMDRFAAEGLLTSDDVAGLPASDQLPFLMALTCSVNRFEIAGVVPLGAALVLRADGGAAAAWGPTGLSVDTQANQLGQIFLGALAADRKARVGELVRRSLVAFAAAGGPKSMTGIYTLMGDPALMLRVPQAAGGNGQSPDAGGDTNGGNGRPIEEQGTAQSGSGCSFGGGHAPAWSLAGVLAGLVVAVSRRRARVTRRGIG